MLCHNEFVDGGAMIAVQQRLQFRTLAAMSSRCGATDTGTVHEHRRGALMVFESRRSPTK